jgi:hypothetical protein
MNRYQPSSPRLAFGVAAVAAAAITLCTLVAVPALIDGTGTALASTAAPTTVAAEPHVDTDSVTRIAEARARRHDLFARAIGAAEHATELRLAGAPRWHLTEDKQ